MKEFLRKIELFTGVGEAGLDKLTRRVKSHDYPTGATIIQENEPGSRCHMIVSGTVRVTARMTDEQDFIAILNPGDHFGEISLIDGQAASASVVAQEPTRTVSLSKDDIMDLFVEDPRLVASILHSMLQTFCRRLRAADQTLAFTRLLAREKGA